MRIISALLNHGAKPHLKNKAGETAAALATRQGHAEAGKLLVGTGTPR